MTELEGANLHQFLMLERKRKPRESKLSLVQHPLREGASRTRVSTFQGKQSDLEKMHYSPVMYMYV